MIFKTDDKDKGTDVKVEALDGLKDGDSGAEAEAVSTGAGATGSAGAGSTDPSIFQPYRPGPPKQSSAAEEGSRMGLRWLPENISWVVLWLAVTLIVYIGRSLLMVHIGDLVENMDPSIMDVSAEIPQFLIILDFSLLFFQVILVVLPLILLTITGLVKRGIAMYDGKSSLAPKAWSRYLFGILEGFIFANVIYVLAVTLYVLNLSFLGMSTEMSSWNVFWQEFSEFAGTHIFFIPLWIPLVISSVLTGIFIAWRMGVAKVSKDMDVPVRPGRVALAAMLVFLLSFSAALYPMAHVWHGREMVPTEQDLMLDDEGFMFDEDMMFGDEEFMFEEGMDFDDGMTWEDIELGEGGELTLDDLLGGGTQEGDFGEEIVLE